MVNNLLAQNEVRGLIDARSALSARPFWWRRYSHVQRLARFHSRSRASACYSFILAARTSSPLGSECGSTLLWCVLEFVESVTPRWVAMHQVLALLPWCSSLLGADLLLWSGLRCAFGLSVERGFSRPTSVWRSHRIWWWISMVDSPSSRG